MTIHAPCRQPFGQFRQLIHMHSYRHAIITLTGSRAVIDGIAFTLLQNFIGKSIDSMVLQLLIHHRPQSGDQGLLVLRQPLVKCRCRVHFLRDALLAIRHHRILIPHTCRPTQLILDRSDLLTQFVDEIKKLPTLAQTTAQQTLTNKNRMRELRIHPSVMHTATHHHRQATADHTLLAIHRALSLIPTRLTINTTTQMRRHLFDPLGINPRHPPRPQTRSLDQLHRHHPFPALRRSKQSRSRKHRKKSSRRTAISFVLTIPQSELPRHTRQQ